MIRRSYKTKPASKSKKKPINWDGPGIYALKGGTWTLRTANTADKMRQGERIFYVKPSRGEA